MATLNTSAEGPAISRSYQSIVDSALPTNPAAGSPTYAQWVVYSVQAPLASAFQQDSTKESVLKVFRTGEGELVDLIDEFSEGKIQFAFVKVKDPNTALQKCVLIAWCGEGVPERTKGYFTSHLAAVSKLLHGYHVQITARTDDDLSPDGIIRKVSDASGSKYSGDGNSASSTPGPPPPVASKPVFTPSKIGGGSSNFAPLGTRSRQPAPQGNLDQDGWGEDAPQVTRSQIQRVEPAYKPTKVNMSDLTSQKPETSSRGSGDDRSDVVRGAYQPVGKVDIAAIRRQAKESGSMKDDRPEPVKGAYEPIGKVDIASIRSRAQPPQHNESTPPAVSPAQTGASSRSDASDSQPKSLADRSSAFSHWERISALPKPKVSNKFGGASSFAGTKAPTPGGFESKPVQSGSTQVGTASRTFADEGGKTPAQIWAEKKARQRGDSGGGEAPKTTPVTSQTSGGSGAGGWESGYSGKKWGSVPTTRTGQSAASSSRPEEEGAREEPSSPPSGGVSAIRDRFKNTRPMTGPSAAEEGASPPPMNLSSKPNAGIQIPPPPAQPQKSEPPSPEIRPSSPIRVAQPVARTNEKEMEAPEERFSAPPMPTASMTHSIPQEEEETEEEEQQIGGHEQARAAAETVVDTSSAIGAAEQGGKRALIQYDYEKQEDNELELREGELVTNIDMVDEDWWMGQNAAGEKGLFPSNYVELVEDDAPVGSAAVQTSSHEPAASPAANTAPAGPTATAQYDYEAAEENELSFPDGAKITNVEFPDDDWWLGEYGGKQGLFPANYVQLDE